MTLSCCEPLPTLVFHCNWWASCHALRIQGHTVSSGTWQVLNVCLCLPVGPARDSLTRPSFSLLTAPANPALINKPANWINKQLSYIYIYVCVYVHIYICILTASWHAIKICDKLFIVSLTTAEGKVGKISHFNPSSPFFDVPLCLSLSGLLSLTEVQDGVTLCVWTNTLGYPEG